VTPPLVSTRPARLPFVLQANCARKCLRRGVLLPAFLGTILCALAFVLLVGIDVDVAKAEPVTQEQMQSLDEQVQAVKSDALSIAAELNGLEEKLLYPSDTQVAVFVSLAGGADFRLDSVQVKIDSEPVADYIYSFKELEALRKGGVQRIYTGNVTTGEHQLDVSVAGKRSDGEDIETTEHFSFRKDVEPKLVAITLAGQDSGDVQVRLGGL